MKRLLSRRRALAISGVAAVIASSLLLVVSVVTPAMATTATLFKEGFETASPEGWGTDGEGSGSATVRFEPGRCSFRPMTGCGYLELRIAATESNPAWRSGYRKALIKSLSRCEVWMYAFVWDSTTPAATVTLEVINDRDWTYLGYDQQRIGLQTRWVRLSVPLNVTAAKNVTIRATLGSHEPTRQMVAVDDIELRCTKNRGGDPA